MMDKIFNIESDFYKSWCFISDLVILNALFILFSLPVITIVPALSALYQTVSEMKEDGISNPAKVFLQFFRSALKSGSMLSLVWLLLAFKFLFESSVLSGVVTNDLLFYLLYFLLIGFSLCLLLISFNGFYSRMDIPVLSKAFLRNCLSISKMDPYKLSKVFTFAFICVLVTLFFWGQMLIIYWGIFGFSVFTLFVRKFL